MPTQTVSFRSADGLAIDGRLFEPDGEPAGLAVICHPHPQYGGSMSSGAIPAIWRAVAAAGWASLRFNFRGVGRSEGTYANGSGELRDAEAALAFLLERYGPRPAATAGWSFGSMVALGLAARPEIGCYVGLAPPIRMGSPLDIPTGPGAGWHARALGICGTEDPFCTPQALERWSESFPAMETRVFEGADHFFTDRHDEIASVVADFIAKA